MSSFHRPVQPSPADHSIVAVVDLVHDLAADRPDPHLVAVSYSNDDLTIATHRLPQGTDPAQALIGWRAPRFFDAVGATTPGRPDPAPVDRSGPSARSTLVVDRAGEMLLLVQEGNGTAEPGLERTDHLIDACSRALGRQTQPPDSTPASWIETTWLDEVAQLAVDPPGHLGWDEIAALHPLAGGEAVDPETLAVATLAVGTRTTWADLRERHRVDLPAGDHPLGGRPVPTASWFDDGSFARFLHRDLPARDDVVDLVLSTVADDVAARIVVALVTP